MPAWGLVRVCVAAIGVDSSTSQQPAHAPRGEDDPSVAFIAERDAFTALEHKELSMVWIDAGGREEFVRHYSPGQHILRIVRCGSMVERKRWTSARTTNP